MKKWHLIFCFVVFFLMNTIRDECFVVFLCWLQANRGLIKIGSG